MEDFYQKMLDAPLLDAETEKKLLQIVHTMPKDSDKYQQALDTLMRANQRWVFKIASKYYQKGLFEMDDLIQEGNLGLLRAIQKFDCNSSFRLTTYATNWIRQFMSRATPKKQIIYIPTHMKEKLMRINKIEAKLASDLQRPATVEEIAEKIPFSFIQGLTCREKTEYKELSNKQKKSIELSITEQKRLKQLNRLIYKYRIETVESILAIKNQPCSYETTKKDSKLDSETHMEEVLMNEENCCNSVEEEILGKVKSNTLLTIMQKKLDKNEITILVYHYGLNGFPTMTLQQIAKLYDVSLNTIKTRENIAKTKLKDYIMKNQDVISTLDLEGVSDCGR